MALKEMIAEYQELLEAKEGLAEATKNNNKAIAEIEEKIAQQMIDDDCPSIGYGDYNYSLTVKTQYSKLSEEKLQAAGLDFFEVLRDEGFGDLIVERVDPRTLNSAMNNLVEEAGELTPGLAEVIGGFEMTKINRRKATNKSLKKLKNKEA